MVAAGEGQLGYDGTTIELASVLPSGTIVPPKRPAHLPARFNPAYPNHAPIIASPGPSPTKPNRYSWAQVQHWQAAAAAIAVASGAQPRQTTSASTLPTHHGFHHHFSGPFSSAASRVLVVNPMQMVNLSEHTKSRLIKFIEALKRFSEKWFSHVLLLLFLAVYACFGAYIFISFEAPTEQWEKQLIIDTRQRIVNESWDEAKVKSREDYYVLFKGKFEDYERLLNRAYASGMTSVSMENQWTFWGALFYSMTVFTTIGYGHLTPITFAGRVATMVYAIFGIPILLMVLADLGKLLTRIIKYSFKKFRYLYNKLLKRKASLRTRKLISDNTNQYIGVARDAFERSVAFIQPHNKFTQAFTKVSFSKRKGRDKVGEEKVLNGAENGKGAHETDNVDSLIETAPPELGPSNDCPLPIGQQTHKRLSETTDVIVTPGKQTKPVSPQPANGKKSQIEHHNHQHHHQNIAHILQHHARHQNHRTNQDHLRRKTSASSASGSAKRQTKGSVSHSSSSSMVAQLLNEQDAQPNLGSPTTNEQTSGAQLETTSEQETQPRVKNENEPKTKMSTDDLEASEDVIAAAAATTASANYEELEDDFDIPVSFALFLLVTYMMFGAVVFSIWEGWNFFDSLYFVFISMSTIGFGDLVPQHPKRMIGTFIYLLFGLALTSMCINVVQEKIHATFLRAKMQIGEKMGLDLDQIMADDYYDSSLGMYGDEDDCNSVAISQANSSSAHHDGCEVLDPSDIPRCANASRTGSLPGKAHFSSEASGSYGDGSKFTRNRESTKNKKRSVAGLPGHSGSMRRKPSTRKMLSRQTTPSSPPHEVQPQSLTPQALGSCQEVVFWPAKSSSDLPVKVESEICKTEPPSLNQPSIIHPVNSAMGICEPLSDGKQNSRKQTDYRPKLVATRSQPISDVTRSPSSESQAAKKKGTKFQTGSSTRHSTLGPHSAGSSRRSSMSQELSQLDDLIVALSQSPSERFGPLLGIPSSVRSSRSNSPPSPLARRGTSMTNRPSSSSPKPNIKKKGSLVIQPSSVSSQSSPPIQPISGLSQRSQARKAILLMASNEAQAALNELEAVKSSIV